MTLPPPGVVATLMEMRQRAEAAQLQRETPSSVEISLTAKGDHTYSVKCYAEVGEELLAATTCLELVDIIRVQLALPPRLPYPGKSS